MQGAFGTTGENTLVWITHIIDLFPCMVPIEHPDLESEVDPKQWLGLHLRHGSLYLEEIFHLLNVITRCRVACADSVASVQDSLGRMGLLDIWYL